MIKKLLIVFGLMFSSLLGFCLEQDKPKIKIGGALRFNYNISSWKPDQVKRGGDFGYDVFRINAKANYKKLSLNAEYRLYSKGFGGGMLKQGWIGYKLNEKNNFQLGLTQVPFGITQYNSHSWFFSINYYVGLEDDHDMGLKYTHSGEKWDFAFAFFKNAEELNFGNNSDVSDSRYSYDVSSIILDDKLVFRNKEVNQGNIKITYKFGNNTKHKIGFSGQFGGLYNLDTKNIGNHYAFAGHYELYLSGFDIKAQIARYQYNPKNPESENDDVIAMTAYGFPYLIASQANMYTLGIAYSFPVNWGFVSNLQVYNDFGYMQKTIENFENSIMNVTGALVTAGQVYTYVDFAVGKNHSWLGPDWTNAFAQGNPNADFEMRFNINIGYYF